MDYGKIAERIGIGVMVVCTLGTIGCLIALVIVAPLLVSIPVTLLILAVAAMVLFAELDRRGA